MVVVLLPLEERRRPRRALSSAEVRGRRPDRGPSAAARVRKTPSEHMAAQLRPHRVGRGYLGSKGFLAHGEWSLAGGEGARDPRWHPYLCIFVCIRQLLLEKRRGLWHCELGGWMFARDSLWSCCWDIGGHFELEANCSSTGASRQTSPRYRASLFRDGGLHVMRPSSWR